MAPSTSPPPLYAATMDWDSSSGQLILFGGTTNGTYDGINETWAWTGTNWDELLPASSPPPRLRATMAMDPASGQLVLFGGYGLGRNRPGGHVGVEWQHLDANESTDPSDATC